MAAEPLKPPCPGWQRERTAFRPLSRPPHQACLPPAAHPSRRPSTTTAQSITFTAPASPVNYGVAPITLTATGGASGNPVTFSIVSGPGSLSGSNNSILTVTGAGTIVIAANQAGNANYAAAPQVTRSITAQNPPPTALSSPAPGAVLAGPTVPFSWTAAKGATGYYLWVGTTPGTSNLYTSGKVTTLTVTPTVLPTDGETLYVRLFTAYNSTLVYTDYTYTAATRAAIISPAPTVLPGPIVPFSWTAANGATGYYLWVGTTKGTSNLYTSGKVTTLTVTPAGLPTDGETLYVRLFTAYNSTLIYTDYTYTAATRAAIISPPPSTVLSRTHSSVQLDRCKGGHRLLPLGWNHEGDFQSLHFGQGHYSYRHTAQSAHRRRNPLCAAVYRLQQHVGLYRLHLHGGHTGSDHLTRADGASRTYSSVQLDRCKGGHRLLPLGWNHAGDFQSLHFGQGHYSYRHTDRSAHRRRNPLRAAVYRLQQHVGLYRLHLHGGHTGYADHLHPRGTVLPGPIVPFSWTAANGATGYYLWVGTTKGTSNLYTSGKVTTLTVTPTSSAHRRRNPLCAAVYRLQQHVGLYRLHLHGGHTGSDHLTRAEHGASRTHSSVQLDRCKGGHRLLPLGWNHAGDL